jgi:hypothetical protein
MAAAAALPFVAPEAGAVGAGAAFAATDVSADIGELARRRKAAGQKEDPVSDIAGGIANAAINAFSGVAMAGPIKGLLGKTAAEQAAALAPKVARRGADCRSRNQASVKHVGQHLPTAPQKMR